MNYFNKLSINKKLRWLQGIVFIGLLFIASAFAANLVITQQFNNELDQLNSLEKNTQTAESLLLQARQIEKDFILDKDISYVLTFNQTISSLSQFLTNVDTDFHAIAGETHEEHIAESHEVDGTDDDIVSDAIRLRYNYAATFTALTDDIETLGLNENSGLQGELRNSVHQVEELVDTLKLAALETSMLKLRRHEKDFILREDSKYIERHGNEFNNFNNILKNSRINSDAKKQLTTLIANYEAKFIEFTKKITARNKKTLALKSVTEKMTPIFEELKTNTQTIVLETKAQLNQTQTIVSYLIFSLVIIIAIPTLYILFKVAQTITTSIKSLSGTIDEISQGNYEARTKLETQDEFGQFANTFDALLDDRVSTLAASEKENETLNNSIIDLMDSVSDLAMRDLTIRATVAEDVTGPVADAINMMTGETVGVLKQIESIAAKVERTALSVNSQSDKVTEFASEERQIVSQTMAALDKASNTMKQIAKVAVDCNTIATKASDSTTIALNTVTDTTKGMKSIRLTTSETEKRIKRLGERSQEINSVVDIINNIAERTHVLALNASMQAAAAGDAGRGFAVVAEEVQRLAESSRQSTSEISALVGNIQSETAEAMSSMNKTIEQVVAGTDLATQSGQQMSATQSTTLKLATAVEKIALYSQKQAQFNENLKSKAGTIVNSTEQTSNELEVQAKQTKELMVFAEDLVKSVSEFKLPA